MKKIACVELLRFISAMMVIIWHYQQFYLPYNFFSEVRILAENRYEQPFYEYLSLFYNYGNRGVDFFFLISGYVFSYVYLSYKTNTTFKTFFVNRLARLYPLHLLTLIIVLFLQIYSIEKYNNFFIHTFNDFYHFFLNLFFVSGWGFEKGPSFNGPIWSVSIEIIIYFLFFLLMIKVNKNRVINSILMILSLILLQKFLHEDFSSYINFRLVNCGILFFEGVLVFYISKIIKKNSFLFILGLILFALSLIGNFKIYIFLPSILFIFLSTENLIKNKIASLFNFLGNLTYGTYLWHLPVQILIMILIKNSKIDYSIVGTKIFFLVYLMLIFIISIASYYFYELKLRKLIRKKFTNI